MQAEGEGDFPYRCPRGSRTVCLLCSDIALVVLSCSGFWAMSAQGRQTVREQADTGYWKIPLPLSLHPLGVGCGSCGITSFFFVK